MATGPGRHLCVAGAGGRRRRRGSAGASSSRSDCWPGPFGFPFTEVMSRTDARPQPRPQVPDRTEPADLHVAVCLGSPLVVRIRGEIDIRSALVLRDERLRVIRAR